MLKYITGGRSKKKKNQQELAGRPIFAMSFLFKTQ